MNTLLDYEFAYKLTMQQNETVTIPFLQKWIYSWAHGFLSVVWQICIRNSRLQVLMEWLDSYTGGSRSPLHVWALLFTNERYRHPGPWRSVQIPVSGSVPASSVCLQHTMPLSSPYTVLCPVSVLLHGPCHWCPPAGPQARGSLSPWLFLTLWWRSRAHGLEPARCPVRVWVCDGAAQTGSSFSVFGPKLEVFRASSGYCAQWSLLAGPGGAGLNPSEPQAGQAPSMPGCLWLAPSTWLSPTQLPITSVDWTLSWCELKWQK